MPRGERQTIREDSQVKVSDLREQFRAASKPAKPAKAAKHVKNAPVRNRPNADKHKGASRQDEVADRRDEQMSKAEKLSQIHHTTSLLTRQPKNDRFRQHKEKKQSGLLLQLVLVMVAAAGVVIAMDPSILPAEVRTLDWQGMQYRLNAWIENVTG